MGADTAVDLACFTRGADKCDASTRGCGRVVEHRGDVMRWVSLPSSVVAVACAAAGVRKQRARRRWIVTTPLVRASRVVALAIAVGLLAAAPAFASGLQLYVSPGGAGPAFHDTTPACQAASDPCDMVALAAWLQVHGTTVGSGNTITVGPGTYDLGGDPTQYNDLRLFNNRWQSDPSQPRPVIVPANYSVEAGGLYLVLDRLEFDFPANSAGLNLFGDGTYDHLPVRGPGTPCVILGGALVDSACVSTGSAGSGLGVGNGAASSTDAGAVTLLNDTFVGSAGGLGVYNSVRYAGANAYSCPANRQPSHTLHAVVLEASQDVPAVRQRRERARRPRHRARSCAGAIPWIARRPAFFTARAC